MKNYLRKVDPTAVGCFAVLLIVYPLSIIDNLVVIHLFTS